MATFQESRKFIESVVPTGLLEDAIDWIRNNMKPRDVFEVSDLTDWAEDNDFIKKNDFSHEEWAADNGYIKSE